MIRIILLIFLILSGFINVAGQSPAHKKSAFAIVDPVYSSSKKSPASDFEYTGA